MQGVNSIGATEYWHAPVSPDCVSVKVSAAIFIVALRPVTSAFRDAEYATVPLPLPWAPLVWVAPSVSSALAGFATGWRPNMPALSALVSY